MRKRKKKQKMDRKGRKERKRRQEEEQGGGEGRGDIHISVHRQENVPKLLATWRSLGDNLTRWRLQNWGQQPSCYWSLFYSLQARDQVSLLKQQVNVGHDSIFKQYHCTQLGRDAGKKTHPRLWPPFGWQWFSNFSCLSITWRIC